MRKLWTERDPRVPLHRRIGADGHPTLADIQATISDRDPQRLMLAVERQVEGDVIGYGGLVESGRPEPASGSSRTNCSPATGVTATRPRQREQ